MASSDPGDPGFQDVSGLTNGDKQVMVTPEDFGFLESNSRSFKYAVEATTNREVMCKKCG